jgi:hypothetical protein
MTHRRIINHINLINSIGCAMRIGVALLALSSCSDALAATAVVTVNANTAISTIPTTAVGVNTAVYDGLMTDSNTVPLLSTAGINVLRYPGGSESDGYHWATNHQTTGPGQGFNWSSSTNFDNFETQVAQPLGVQPVITVNYGSNAAFTGGGDPAEAAAWVTYANVTKNYGVKYWEIGNEIYGNGFFNGADWETDLHFTDQTPSDRVGQASLSPTTYGQNVVLYANAMKAADPTIKIGAFVTLPNAGFTGWNANVLQQCGTKIDFVIIHSYPENTSSSTSTNDNDASLLNVPSTIAAGIASVKADINQFCGANAPNVQIWVTETNSDSGAAGRQMMSAVQALFVADDIQTWLENGASNVDYWDLRNGATDGFIGSSVFGTFNFGDEGILSNGSTSNLGQTEPPADTPFASYYALEMVHTLGSPGDAMVATSSSQTLLTTHAVKHADGSLSILELNKSRTATFNTTINLSNFKPTWAITTSTFGANPDKTNTAFTTQTTFALPSIALSIPPYTMETVTLQPQAVNVPSHTFPAGLQMISMPCDFTGVDPTTTLSPPTPMAFWDSTAGAYSVAPATPADAYRAGHGYWIHAASTGAFIGAATGTTPGASVTVNLGTGWNLIGDPYAAAEPEASMSVQVGTAASESLQQAVTAGTISTTLFTFAAGATDYTQQDVSAALQPYAGYWLYASSPCTLTYTTPGP